MNQQHGAGNIRKRFKFDIVLVAIVSLAAALRFVKLGTVFESSDNVALAASILRNPGNLWMLQEYYGFVISFVVKLFISTISSFDITVTEFWWKAPVAFFGTIQTIVLFYFLRWLKVKKDIAYIGIFFLAIFPIHVMQSRFLWGFEVIGSLFLTMSIWSLIIFFQNPNKNNSVIASLFVGIYLISHALIIPFAVCIFLIVLLFYGNQERNYLQRITGGFFLLFEKFVWILPIIFLAFYHSHLIHAFEKQTRFGFYLDDHFSDIVGDLGIFMFGLVIVSIVSVVLFKKYRRKETTLFFLTGFAYVAPLWFGAPAGLTGSREYMLVGIYCLLVGMILVADKMFDDYKKILTAVLFVSIVATGWGTVETVFTEDGMFDPSLVSTWRGGVVETGSKAAAYAVRKYVPKEAEVFVFYNHIEPYNFTYYFDREKGSYFDMSLPQYIEKFSEVQDEVDVIIVGKDMLPYVENMFVKRMTVYSNHQPIVWILSRENIFVPEMDIDTEIFNKKFDQEYAWKINF